MSLGGESISSRHRAGGKPSSHQSTGDAWLPLKPARGGVDDWPGGVGKREPRVTTDLVTVELPSCRVARGSALLGSSFHYNKVDLQ
ncbi:hypothetical protein Taro_052205 [Colocasia esculenta]|uniref:Uncharacterized protein n=1 Tax=Colocasia esculenta TaxID=4460 RepID=A0A843XJB9_COLES|nr:hypothetical protein [Colocasia esculenta]